MTDKLYIPYNFKPKWFDDLYGEEGDRGLDCIVHDDHGTSEDQLGCTGMNCKKCIFYGPNITDGTVQSITNVEYWTRRED